MSKRHHLYYQRDKELARLLNIKKARIVSPLNPIDSSDSEDDEEPMNVILDGDSYVSSGDSSDLDSDDDVNFDDLSYDDASYDDASCDGKSKTEVDISLLLYLWCLQFNITNNAMSALLVILKKHFPELPKDCRTFKRTPRKTIVQKMSSGTYFHFGLLETITNFLSKNCSRIMGNVLNIDVGIDGLPLFKSSRSQFWPILGNISGFSDIFVIGNYHGDSKPVDSEIFLKQFIEDGFDKIKNGIIYNGKKYLIKFRAFICDAPARSFVLQIKGHTGYSACTKCTTKGSYILNRVTFPELDAPKRTDNSFLNRQDINHHHTTDMLGLEKLEIGCVTQFPLDYMHCVLLGVMKQMLTLWIKVKRRPFSLSSDVIDHISKLLLLLSPQVTFEFKRRPRSLENFEKFKATEFRLFLLYIGPIVLKKQLPAVYYDHFLKFHVAVRILSDPVDCIKNNNLAKELLIDFVKDFYFLYGEHTITFNVHNLIHVADDVLKFGHFDSYSAFKFENHMQVLKKRVRKGSQPLKQLINRIREEESMTESFGYNESIFPEFKIQLKDRSYTSVLLQEHKLSIRSPNNFCFIQNKIVKITKIEDTVTGVMFTGLPVKNLVPFYNKPIDSSSLKIYSTENIQFEPEIKFPNQSIKKVLHLCLNEKSVFMPNMHIN